MTNSFSPRRTITLSILEAIGGALITAAVSIGGILVVDHFTLSSLDTRVSAVEGDYVTNEKLEDTIKPVNENVLEMKAELKIISEDIKRLLRE